MIMNSLKIEALLSTILKLQSLEETKKFFRDLLTENELQEFSTRWQAAQMLENGKTYKEVQKATGLSSTTVARINYWRNSGMNGYKIMFDRVHHNSP